MILKGANLPEFKKYPDICRIEKNMGIMDTKEVVVTEKIHGSNFRIKVTEEGLLLGSREITIQEDNKNFNRFFPVIEEYAERIIDYFMPFITQGKEVILFGEAYGRRVSKGMYL